MPLLDLPNLRTLDLSHNRLQSLDFLQLLLELRTLLVSHNNINSLLMSVNTLVPLALHLTTLDLSNNPVCKDLRYAEEVLSVLPGLRYFDSIDMNTFGKTYRATKSSVLSSYSTQEPRTIGYSDRSESFLRSTASSRSRSESQTVRGRRYVSTAPEAIPKETSLSTLPEFPCVASPSPPGAVGEDVRLLRDPAFELKLMRSSVTSSPSRAISNNSRGAHSSGRSNGRKSKSTVEAPTQSALIRWQSFGIIPAQHRCAVGDGNDEASEDQSTAASTSLHSRHGCSDSIVSKGFLTIFGCVRMYVCRNLSQAAILCGRQGQPRSLLGDAGRGSTWNLAVKVGPMYLSPSLLVSTSKL